MISHNKSRQHKNLAHSLALKNAHMNGLFHKSLAHLIEKIINSCLGYATSLCGEGVPMMYGIAQCKMT